MNGGAEPLPAPLRQLPLALAAAAVAAGVHLFVGLALLVLLAVVSPPAVPWAPARAIAVVRSYLPFAALWLLFAFGYLYAMRAGGHAVAPQSHLEALARDGFAVPGCALLLCGIVVVAPFAEELLFRGYLLAALAVVLPSPWARITTAALFGLAHGIDYALPIGVLGYFFGQLRHRHGALLPSVLAHALHNGLTVAVAIAWPASLDLLYPR